jgi:transposase
MDADRAALAEEVASLRAELAIARAKASEDMALIAQQKLRIAKLEHQIYGQRSERSARLIEQLALTFEELEASATEDELAAEQAVARTTAVAGFTRKRPDRTTFPDHLPRERVVVDPPTTCECCGSHRLRKLGEDVTRTLETQPRQWKVIETVREKFTCRDCEKISQAPAPFHVIARGWAGASLLAMMVFEKFGQHQPLNRQAERYALEGVPIALSTMADAVGSVCKALDPLLRLVEAHVMAAGRLHGDDTTVPVLAKGKTVTGRCWVYVRDDQPFGGAGPPAAMFYYSRDRRGEHPQAHLVRYAGILQADAYDGYNRLYLPDRKPGPIQEAACWVHLWMPPLLQELFLLSDENPRLLSSIRPVMTARPAPSALMVNPQAETQSRVTSSRLDAPSGFIQLRFARFRHHTLKDSSHPRRLANQPMSKILLQVMLLVVEARRRRRQIATAPIRRAPSYWRAQRLQHSPVDGPAIAPTMSRIDRASA